VNRTFFPMFYFGHFKKGTFFPMFYFGHFKKGTFFPMFHLARFPCSILGILQTALSFPCMLYFYQVMLLQDPQGILHPEVQCLGRAGWWLHSMWVWAILSISCLFTGLQAGQV